MPPASSNARLLLVSFTAMLSTCFAGCAVFEAPQASASQSSAFAWLTNWVGQPMDAAAGFEVESLRPEPRPHSVAAGELLEVTVWDLYEPGKAYTFPVRVTEKKAIEVPLLGEFPVADRTCAQVEAGLAEGYKTGEFLVNPRVLVRSLDPPLVKVQVSGALVRPGFVELSRNDTSVYAAVISAGGLRKTAGRQVGIARRSEPTADSRTTARLSSMIAGHSADGSTAAQHAPDGNVPEHHANHMETLSVDPARNPQSGTAGDGRSDKRDELFPRDQTESASNFLTSSPTSELTRWFDLARPEDQAELRNLKLGDGDEVIIKATAPPVRIGGVVERPGAYPIPSGSALDVWQAISLAGGVRTPGVPLNITLIHAAADGRPAKRWFLNVADYDQHPAESPLLEPGDVLHVEPTAGGKIKRVVGDLWNKP